MPPTVESKLASTSVPATSPVSAPTPVPVQTAEPAIATPSAVLVKSTVSPSTPASLTRVLKGLPLPLVVAAAASVAAVSALALFIRGRSTSKGLTKTTRRSTSTGPINSADKSGAGSSDQGGRDKKDDKEAKPGPFARLKATSRCVPLADGSACVVRREIPADNSCLFNAVGYCMHHSKTRASFLRSVVAREVSSHPDDYTPVFLGMHNAEYCRWIEDRMNWGGAIELSILVKHYNREIAAWNVETAKAHTFGEEAGFPKQVMVIYTGSHYDALAIAAGPKAPDRDDTLEFNPRTKRGKMILAAARKLAELTHQGSKFYKSTKLKCGTCNVVLKGQLEAAKHAEKTGHDKFEEAK